jgi:ferredoxin-type protein NapF
MSSGLSRRGLLRAVLAASRPEPETVLVARIGASCVEPSGVACRRCGDVCDEDAIRFAPLPGGRAMPVLEAARCSGCGECLAPCPTQAISLVSFERAQLVSGLAQLETRA